MNYFCTCSCNIVSVMEKYFRSKETYSIIMNLVVYMFCDIVSRLGLHVDYQLPITCFEPVY